MILSQLITTIRTLKLIVEEMVLDVVNHGMLLLKKMPQVYQPALLSDVPLELQLKEKKTQVVLEVVTN